MTTKFRQKGFQNFGLQLTSMVSLYHLVRESLERTRDTWVQLQRIPRRTRESSEENFLPNKGSDLQTPMSTYPAARLKKSGFMIVSGSWRCSAMVPKMPYMYF